MMKRLMLAPPETLYAVLVWSQHNIWHRLGLPPLPDSDIVRCAGEIYKQVPVSFEFRHFTNYQIKQRLQ